LAGLGGTGLVHISGVTLAIIDKDGRRNLLRALETARSKRSVASYDPNVRPRLWKSASELQYVLREVSEVVDIIMPSFDDEAMVWGDSDLQQTATRIAKAGVSEIIVKNGRGEITLLYDGAIVPSANRGSPEIRDTTGAGDSFNAGYLSTRLAGMTELQSCELGQGAAATTIRCFGAMDQ